MSATLAECYTPVELIAEVDRLAVSDVAEAANGEACLEPVPVDWDQVNQLVQGTLRRLADRVQERRPETRSQAGRTSAQSFHLFAYRVIEVPSDHGILPLVVGVDFDPAPDGSEVIVAGDITAEETGEVFYEVAERRVARTREAVLTAAYEVAGELANQVDLVVDNLAQARFPPHE
jgi:hypothetical protein